MVLSTKQEINYLEKFESIRPYIQKDSQRNFANMNKIYPQSANTYCPVLRHFFVMMISKNGWKYNIMLTYYFRHALAVT